MKITAAVRLWFLLSLVAARVLPAADVQYRVQNRTLHAIDSRLFGSFTERPSWGEKIGPEAALIAGTNRVQPAVITCLRDVRIPIVRFPGGTDADFIVMSPPGDVLPPALCA
jgi:hypothetical protein